MDSNNPKLSALEVGKIFNNNFQPGKPNVSTIFHFNQQNSFLKEIDESLFQYSFQNKCKNKQSGRSILGRLRTNFP